LLRISKANLHSFGRAYPFTGYEIDPNGVITKFISVGGESLASKKGTSKYFYHNDHLGSVNVVTDIAGTRVQLIEYDPWGAVSRSEGILDPDTRFTGQKLDPETGLYYYGGRYYDAEIGRFISADPFVQTPFDPQNLNRYSYVINNPQNYIDPDGYFHIHKKKKPSFFQRFFGFFIGAFVFVLTGDPSLAFIARSIVDGGVNGGAPGAAMGLFTAGAYLYGGPPLGAVFSGINSEMNGGSFWKGFENGLRYSPVLPNGSGFGVMRASHDEGPPAWRLGPVHGNLGLTSFLRQSFNPNRADLQHLLNPAADRQGLGPQWGVYGSTNNETIAQMQKALRAHVSDPTTNVIIGTSGGQGVVPSIHFYNPGTGMVVSMVPGTGRLQSPSGFQVSRQQAEILETTFHLGTR
jgi:RHS repeat-associated protein